MTFGNRLRRPARTLRYAAAAASLAVAVPVAALAHAGPGDPASRAEAQTVPVYLNRACTPAERAADLVSRMTTAEKAAQMDSTSRR